jgi:signal transduction histidine kinase
MGELEILLVEDNPNDIKLTLHALDKNRIANPIVVLHDGAEAIQYLFKAGENHNGTRTNLKLILLDLKLPKVDGIEVLRRLKSDPLTRRIPVVMLTARACMHLIANAVLYSPEGSQVRVGLEATDASFQISITDEGIGIPAGDQDNIFDVFFRGSNAESRPGVGVGLTVAKLAVEAHNGTITFQQNAPCGSTFTMHVPLKPVF